MHDAFINQPKMKIKMCKFTVDWLVNNTVVKVFNPVTFEGYQRQIDEKHANKIVNYILNSDFYLPSSIICSTEENEELTMNTKLSIVDGQHRIEAFRLIRENHPKKYDEIKDYEVSVIVLISPDEKDEIDTFITINKTSKTVDTSLAFVLKNLKNKGSNSSEDIDISRREYMAVEVARELNSDNEYKWWYNKIKYEGPTKNTYELITLNAFVKSLRSYLGCLEKSNVVMCKWDNNVNPSDIVEKVKSVASLLEYTWDCVYLKWKEIDSADNEERRIIQGPIGFTAINRYMSYLLKKGSFSFISMDEYKLFVKQAINEIEIDGNNWKKERCTQSFHLSQDIM